MLKLTFAELLFISCLSFSATATSTNRAPTAIRHVANANGNTHGKAHPCQKYKKEEREDFITERISLLITEIVSDLVNHHHQMLAVAKDLSVNEVDLELRLVTSSKEHTAEWMRMTRYRRSSRPRVRMYIDDATIREFCSTHNFPTILFNPYPSENQTYHPNLTCQSFAQHQSCESKSKSNSGHLLIYSFIAFFCVITVFTLLVVIVNEKAEKRENEMIRQFFEDHARQSTLTCEQLLRSVSALHVPEKSSRSVSLV